MWKILRVLPCFLILLWSRANAQATVLPLQDAITKGYVQVDSIVGGSVEGYDYSQPLLELTLTPVQGQTPSGLQISLPAGSMLQPTQNGPVMIALAFDPPNVSIDATNTQPIKASILAFTLKPALYPTVQQTYTLAAPTNDAKLQSLLERLHSQYGRNGSQFGAQIAVWQMAANKDFAAIDAELLQVFGISLQGTDDAAFAARLLAPPASVTSSSPATNNLTDNTTSATNGSTNSSSNDSLLGMLVVGIILVGLVFAIALSQAGRNGGKDKPPILEPEQPSANQFTHTPQQVKIDQTPKPPVREPGDYVEPPRVKVRSREITTPLTSKSQAPNNVPPSVEPIIDQPKRAVPPSSGNKSALRTTPSKLPEGAQLQRAFHNLASPNISLVDAERNQHTIPSTAVILTRSRVQQTQLNDPSQTVSTPHCIIAFFPNEGSWRIRDLASRNGTEVNGQKIAAKKEDIASGSELKLGDVYLRFIGNATGTSATLEQLGKDGSVEATYLFDSSTEQSEPYWVITRDLIEQVAVEDRSVSTPHALLTFDDGWTIRDLNSSNGTLLKRTGYDDAGDRIGSTPKRVEPNDTVYFSQNAQFQFVQPELPRLGDYQLHTWVGIGGMACVFSASHQNGSTPSPQVLKLLVLNTREAKSAFAKEWEVMQLLQATPHVVQYIDHGEDPHYGSYVVLQYIKGATLQSVLRVAQNKAQANPQIAIKIGICVATALAELHSLGWTHCDVKPENILLQEDGNVFLADFGVVTPVGDRPFFGTSLYTAPEVRNDKLRQPASAATDVYSLGVVLFEVLNGSIFDPDTNSFVQSNRIAPITLPTTVGPSSPPNQLVVANQPLSELHAVIDRCICPVEQRYTSMEELLDALHPLQTVDYDLSPLVRLTQAFT